MDPPSFNLSRLKLIFHARKSVRLAGALLGDQRIPRLSKLAFVGGIGGLGVALLVPELASDVAVGMVPVVGPLLDLVGIPTEGGLDWVTVVFVATGLLKLFPANIVGEHYARIFGDGPRPGPKFPP